MGIKWMAAGAALGVLSRIDETALGIGISSSPVWLAVALAVGAVAARAPDAVAGGAITLTFANVGYYVWAGHTFGRPVHWFELGVVAGATCGLLGLAFRRVLP